ncbi:MAG: aldo/keto reductase [Thermoguttaceae bacterium]|nr:aldo/keto reductase [Thermoguttaceae bacterium]
MIFSKMMLGTVQFGLNYGIANKEGQPSLEKVKGILRSAAEFGVNTLDTAAAYGTSEEVLGQALEESGLAERFQIITKIPVFPAEMSEKDAELLIRESLDRSLERLRRSKLRAVLIHNEQNLSHFSVLERVCAEGYADGAGVSLDSHRSLAEFRETVFRAKYVQLPSNLVDRRFDEFIDDAPQRGAFVFTRSACLQGLLLLPADDVPPHLRGILPWREKARGIADCLGISVKELCFRYLISLPGVASIVFGVDNQEQLAENCSYAEKGPLPDGTAVRIRSEIPLLEESLIRPFLWPRRAEEYNKPRI